MKNMTAVVASALVLASCGASEKGKSASDIKDASAEKSNYQCVVQSTLDVTVPEAKPNWSEQFEYKASDISVTKSVGVTNGDRYGAMISRETNSVGERINLVIVNIKNKASSVTQVAEGSKDLFLTMTPDGKFQITAYCVKK